MPGPTHYCQREKRVMLFVFCGIQKTINFWRPKHVNIEYFFLSLISGFLRLSNRIVIYKLVSDSVFHHLAEGYQEFAY